MNLVFLHGPAASGKLTVGRELSRRPGYRLFHNHLVVDAVTAVFEFGSESFVRLREKLPSDLSLDTGVLSPEEAAMRIREHL